MALAGQTLTEQEKTAIVALLYGYLPTWGEAYRIAAGQTEKEAEQDPHFTNYVSKWKHSAKVQRFTQKVYDKKAVDEHELIKEYEREKRSKPGKDEGPEKATKSAFVDYANPENQRQKLNELINEATDPGEALDALKVIISGQRDDRQAAREGRQIRAYLPLTCQQCPLYEAAKAKT